MLRPHRIHRLSRLLSFPDCIYHVYTCVHVIFRLFVSRFPSFRKSPLVVVGTVSCVLLLDTGGYDGYDSAGDVTRPHDITDESDSAFYLLDSVSFVGLLHKRYPT